MHPNSNRNTETATTTVLVPIRLRLVETKMLAEMKSSEQVSIENTGEFFRLLLHREYNRRKGLGPPSPREWQSAFRTKPRK